ncbi:hypothetical protein GBP346_B0292 [Burkholderia pseudomallei MSHR346]|nr:hypothetical protein BUC_5197 [Burkholderia pseudomallei 576]EEP49240.1 hypothetical protein GBP346_B0292 [Burkholderia pseudomallei MSHR346]
MDGSPAPTMIDRAAKRWLRVKCAKRLPGERDAVEHRFWHHIH